MTGPAERAAARRAARGGDALRPGSASAKGRAAVSGRVASAAAAVRERPTLTSRAVVLASVCALLVFTLAVPMRELFRQRTEINELRSQNAAAQVRVDQLTVREERLQDPAYVTSLVRERLHYLLPGEVGYVVLDPNEAPAPRKPAVNAAGPAWYASLWSAVESADHAGVPVGPVLLPVRPNAPR
jgi:cell division protein FtsB